MSEEQLITEFKALLSNTPICACGSPPIHFVDHEYQTGKWLCHKCFFVEHPEQAFIYKPPKSDSPPPHFRVETKRGSVACYVTNPEWIDWLKEELEK